MVKASLVLCLGLSQVKAEDDFAAKLKRAEEALRQAPPASRTPQRTAAPAPAKAKAKTSPLPSSRPHPAADASPAPVSVSAVAPPPPSPAQPAPVPADVESRLAALEKAQAAWSKLKAEAFTQLRYDSQGKLRGAYVRRAEAKVLAKLWDGGSAVLGWDLAEGKLKDVGLDWELPGLRLQVGQFRQKFGLEPQQGSTKTWFAERALMYGGLQPTAAAVKIVGERVLGLHAVHKKKLGSLGVEAGLSLANNLSEDQAGGKNKLGAADAFPKQVADENPSLAGRAGVELALGKLKAGLGASLARDNQNTVFLASKPAEQRYEELAGADLALDWAGLWKLQAEWLGSSQLRGDLGLSLRREGWVAQQSLQPLALFLEGAPKVELLGRYELVQPNVHAGAPSLAAATAGLKWSFAGAQHLLLQYTCYGPRQDFGAGAGSELWLLQQQLTF